MPYVHFQKMGFYHLFCFRSLSILGFVVNSCSYLQDPKCNLFPVDASVFVTRHESIVGLPPLLRYLASKDEIIYAVIREHYSRFATESDNTECGCYRNAAISFLSHFESTTAKILHRFVQPEESAPFRPNNVAWNPLATLTLITRFTKILKPLLSTLDPSSEYEYSLKKKIIAIMWDLGWPTDMDLQSAASSILKIQHVQDFSTSDLANGWIDGVETGIFLSAQDCNSIGRQAIYNGFYALALEWFEEAAEQLSKSSREINQLKWNIAVNSIQMAAIVHDSLFDRSESWAPTFFTTKVNDKPSSKIRRRTYELETRKGEEGIIANEINYWGLCSGGNYQMTEQKAKLFCYYERKSNSAWAINPVKVEIVSFKPLLILQYYDLFGESTIRKLKNEASEKFSQVYDDHVGVGVSTESQKFIHIWIDDNYHEEYDYIPRTIELITGLRVRSNTSSEELAIGTTSYSGGLHYKVHLDAYSSETIKLASERDKEEGDRVATFMLYFGKTRMCENEWVCDIVSCQSTPRRLFDTSHTHIYTRCEIDWGCAMNGEPTRSFDLISEIFKTQSPYLRRRSLSDVEKGGGTAFPQSGIAVSPVRGSAVLWYNLKSSGELNPYSWHGSCPVVLGEKWLATKWIRLHDQMFVPQFKCAKDLEETITMTVNGKSMAEFF